MGERPRTLSVGLWIMTMVKYVFLAALSSLNVAGLSWLQG